ncbi:MAG: polymerase sigma-70 factor, subfamily [Frankiaceae bacterium]|jgi:RNA polymerase sigma-70 factor (ECF subfamily)|nr:polymerase sigma-70 factor, subfamily [Frankiaceae bacterium]MDX6273744.1 polymerase sigma-70 factor, subfamily [Frankiales bacterium]
MDDDATLLRRHTEGDPDAFGELVLRHRDRLWAVALRTLGDREEAADALQDALLSAFRAAGGYRGDAQVTTWLHRIVVNACIDRTRRRASRPTVPLDERTDSVPDPRDDTATVDLRHELLAALASLPVDQAAALVLVDVEGHSVQEAALMLEVPIGTVKSRCARGRTRLAVTLGHLRTPRNPTSPPAVQPPQPADQTIPEEEAQAP